MRYFLIMRLCVSWLFCIIFNMQPIFAQNQILRTDTNFTYHSKQYLGLVNGLRFSDKASAKIKIKYNLNNISSQLTFNYKRDEKYILDGSYFQYSSGIATYGAGIIDRHWSFSDKSSLILSHNARPQKSIYLKLKNKFNYDWAPSEANWSLEVFNGITEGSLSNEKSMMLGIRGILSPIEGLDFEFVQTSQWGGKGYNTNISALSTALFLDSNNGSNFNINKMAGFGISYLIPSNKMPLRFYGQGIGEDEAGGLPSCYTYLAGFEWSNVKIKYPTTVGIETVDTRVDTTKNGYCGANTMYNNNVYDYTNHKYSMGAAIDSEGTSLELFGKSQISQKINIKYSTKLVVINDTSWSNHRLSSKRQSGYINSFSVSWNKDAVNLKGSVHYQNLNLNKTNIKSGYGVNISSSILF